MRQPSPIKMMACSHLVFIATVPLLTNGFATNKRPIITMHSSKATISSRNVITSSSSSLHVAGSKIDETWEPSPSQQSLSSSSAYLSTLETSNTSSSNNNNDNESPLTYLDLVNLPRHPSNEDANTILSATEKAIRSMQQCELYHDQLSKNTNTEQPQPQPSSEEEIPIPTEQESVYANSYVDLSKVSTIGFDYDYTLVTYTQELLSLIYDMALRRLVEEKEYPREMLESGLRFDPFFSIRGEWCIIFHVVVLILWIVMQRLQ